MAMVFALSTIPVGGLIATAVDLAQASRVRQQLQEAFDAAVLEGAKRIGRPAQEIIDATRSFALANLPASMQNIQLDVQIVNNNTTVRLSLTEPFRMQTSMLAILGITSMSVSTSAEATNGYTDLEIVLALDNTGSMNGTKISVLRTAVTNFINAMEIASNTSGRPNSVRIGIVPFDRFVRMGSGFRTQNYINFALNGVDPNSWEGCVTDRDQPNDVQDTAPIAGNAATHFVAVRNTGSTPCGLEPILDLTNDWNALRTTASRMRAAGNTNVTIGLVHGWHMLTTNEPYTRASVPRERLNRVMIMLTDGDNTQNRWTTNGNTIDLRTQSVCNNLRTSGILVYTIRVINGDAALLQACATTPTMYYNVTSAEQITTVFDTLASQMTALRISR